jgi:hypothetical protein
MTTPRTLITCLAAALTALCMLLTPGLASAAVPGTLTEQGRLFDEAGDPISGDLVIEFNLYAESEDGTALWTESHNVTIEDGYFSVQLGSDTAFPAGAFDGTTRFLGITVGTDTEMSPRQEVSSVPYALHAGSADTVAWGGITGFPTPCATGQYLTGYNASGVAQCTVLPSLSCTTRFSALETDGSTFVGCQAGEVLTGGGCYTNGALQSSYPWACTSTGPIICLCLDGSPCGGDYVCSATSTSASVRAYANCCKVQ